MVYDWRVRLAYLRACHPYSVGLRVRTGVQLDDYLVSKYGEYALECEISYQAERELRVIYPFNLPYIRISLPPLVLHFQSGQQVFFSLRDPGAFRADGFSTVQSPFSKGGEHKTSGQVLDGSPALDPGLDLDGWTIGCGSASLTLMTLGNFSFPLYRKGMYKVEFLLEPKRIQNNTSVMWYYRLASLITIYHNVIFHAYCPHTSIFHSKCQ